MYNYRMFRGSDVHEVKNFPEKCSELSLAIWAFLVGAIDKEQCEYLEKNLHLVTIKEEVDTDGIMWNRVRLNLYEYDKRLAMLKFFERALNHGAIHGNVVKVKWLSKNVLYGTLSSTNKKVGAVTFRYNMVKKTVTVSGDVSNFAVFDIVRFLFHFSYNDIVKTKIRKSTVYTLNSQKF